MSANRAGAGVTSGLSKRGRTAGWVIATFLVSLSTGAGAFELLTRNPTSGVPQNGGLGNSSRPALTPDGRYVAFESTATNLVTPDSAGGSHVFLFDRTLNTLVQVDISVGGLQPNGTSFRPSISADGCKVAFGSSASNLVASDFNASSDIFVRDRCTGQTTRVSVATNGIEGNAASQNANISANGRYVAFESYAANLAAGSSSGSQVYLRDLQLGTTIRISANFINGGGGNFDSGLPSISADGSRIAFWSFASDLVSGDTNELWDIFLWDANAVPPIRMVSTASNGAQRQLVNSSESASRIVEPGLSGDGRYVSFTTTSTDLVGGGTTGRQHVYVKDTLTGSIVRASVTSAGAEGSGDSPSGQGERSDLSFDGRWVLFTTRASNLHRGGPGSVNLVARNIATGQTRDFFTAPGFGLGDRPAISGDVAGRFIAFFSSDSLDPRFASSGIFIGDLSRGLRTDFNGDGRSDITWKDPAGQSAVWLMNGTSASGTAVLLGGGSGWSIARTDGDFNGDGRTDILWKHTDGSWAIWLMNGTSQIGAGLLFGAGNGWQAVHLGDFNNDGRTDVLWKDANGQYAIWLMNGTSLASAALIFGGGTTWTVTHVADFNGDGASDLLFKDAAGQLAVYLMNGTGVLNAALIYNGGPYVIANVGDFNGDGRADLAFTGPGNAVAIWLMNGIGTLNAAVVYTGGTFALTHLGDFDGDGKADLVFKDGAGQVAIWTMNGLAASSVGIVFAGGGGWVITSLGDFDGDGRSDFLWKDAGGQVAMWTLNGLAVTNAALIFGGGGGWITAP